MKGYVYIKISTLRKLSLALLSLLAIAAVAFFALEYRRQCQLPYVETKAYHELRADGKTVMYFRHIANDTTMRGMALTPVNAGLTRSISVSPAHIYRMVEKSRSVINLRISQLDSVRHELEYYLDRHNVQDEGFDMVAARMTVLTNERTRLEKWRDALSAIDRTTRLETRRIATTQRIDSVKPSPIFVGIQGGVWTGGRWLRMQRSGKGVAFDNSRRLVTGKWNADTIVNGTRYDSCGIYTGHMNKWMQACGHGSYTYADRTTYEGRFEDDREDGFGVAINTTSLKAGEWSNGKFRGERMQYTSERIYGIDISKYQHGKGRKKYPILWKRLRITSLGHLSRKNVNGATDYPVSFVYIKSTEGTTIRNRFFHTDYTQARKHGIHVGAYHFFSTRTPGASQARFFLRNTRLRKGDMPPVLDVEPTTAQINKMGGADALFRNVRQWLKAVEAATGTKPVLYVSQSFVNKYLDRAPDIKRNYLVWIARYGEFKPDVKLLFWQLSPDGRVRGIHGDVDINVFNGYQSQFDEFIRQNCIK